MSETTGMAPEAVTELPPSEVEISKNELARQKRNEYARQHNAKKRAEAKAAKKVGRPAIQRTAEDARHAGVGSTERAAKAEPVRTDASLLNEITRQSLEDRQTLAFDLPDYRKKPGWDYKWEVISIMGQQVGREVLRDAHRAGWRPELAKDWPEFAEGLRPDDLVEEGGQRLMGRPLHLSHEAQVETYNKAKTQERDRMQAASTGQSVGGQEGLSNVRGVQVRNSHLQVELAIGSGPSAR